ncbi:LysR family transcriptional regulator [Falsirhodobacter halotolerans]|uniref:LysR family transcriptional regulator n=1 Tax=Falsirhodobacter halotolerans TaxID=1146892 RepID=UPI001FD1CE82|nr:LysR family transcriptional regulator [Falsirhodobacter halotolerans]MCJ8140897.1 LysR family transcriptional regulator [Falsirhodobacter halotolerans]
MTLDARDIRIYLAVHRFRSIRAAAAHLGLAPSIVSRQIAVMERDLGVPLFDRSARGVTLTDAGNLVLEHARRAVEEFGMLEEQLSDLRGVQQRNVRIHCGEGFLADFVQNGLAGILTATPHVRYELRIGSTDAVLDALANGDSDIGIAYNPPVTGAVRSVASARHPLCAVLPPGHPLAAGDRVALAECLRHPVALLPAGHGTTDLLARVALDSGLALAPRLITTSIDALRRFVTAGMGIAFLPRASVAMDLADGAAEVRELADLAFTSASAHLMVRARRRLPASVAQLADHLEGAMASFTDRS